MTEALDARIKSVMEAVLEVSADELHDAVSPDNLKAWDSVNHMNLVLALEEEFEVSFTDMQIVEMMNYELVRSAIVDQTGA